MRLSAGLSLRAQLAWLAAAGSLLAAVMAAAIWLPVIARVSDEQASADTAMLADVIATRLVQACAGESAPGRCEEAELARLLDGQPIGGRILEGREPLAPPGGPAAMRRLGDAPRPRWLVVERMESGTAADRIGVVVRLAMALAVLAVGLVFVFLYFGLVRTVARPADRLLAATDRVGSEAPLVAEGGPVLGRLGVAFDRMGARLADERRTVEAQVEALRAANRSLAEARQSALRQEKLATVGRLAAGVAHEIGNPLAALLGYMQVLRGKPEASTLAPYVEPMEREARRIDRILRDLLDFARPARPLASSFGSSVPRTIERTLRLLEPQRRFRDVQTRLAIAPGLPMVSADEHQLGQVLVNLLLNAADAMGGTGLVTIDARPNQAGSAVILVVRDTGPGIPPEHLAQLFDPFFTTKPPGEGTGLGLAICHSLVESFGGTIAAANAPGGGAEFRIELPLADGNVAGPAVRG